LFCTLGQTLEYLIVLVHCYQQKPWRCCFKIHLDSTSYPSFHGCWDECTTTKMGRKKTLYIYIYNDICTYDVSFEPSKITFIHRNSDVLTINPNMCILLFPPLYNPQKKVVNLHITTYIRTMCSCLHFSLYSAYEFTPFVPY